MHRPQTAKVFIRVALVATGGMEPHEHSAYSCMYCPVRPTGARAHTMGVCMNCYIAWSSVSKQVPYLRFQPTVALLLAVAALQRIDRVQSVTDAMPQLVRHLQIAATPHNRSGGEHVVGCWEPHTYLHSSASDCSTFRLATPPQSGGRAGTYLHNLMVPHSERALEVCHEL